jgi:hypothetical protein
MAVCTAQVGDDAEGFFALDFITGDLKGWVYYPKMGARPLSRKIDAVVRVPL